MNVSGITQESFLSYLKVELGAQYTQEQLDMIARFGDGPTFCFADPGTGKTYTAVGGLINAELFKQIPGKNIYAMSFTRLATGELSVRHKKACTSLRISQTVNIQTLHSLCRTILKENYQLLGMSKFDTSQPLTFEQSYNLVESFCEEKGINITPAQIRGTITACNRLNAALIFDQHAVESRMAFKQANVDYDIFEEIRGCLFSYSLLTETISVSDLLLYTVLLMQRHPEVSQKFKENCKLLLVDEAQDLSLLQLRVISFLTDNPIFIGDVKQQIYGFNGACQEIVQEAHRLFPGMVDMALTQSFRCKNEIADYATKIILHNHIGGEDFRGVGEGGQVHVVNGLYEDGLDIVSLADKLHSEFVYNLNSFTKEYMFLDRTNVGLIPVIEELFRQHLPFRVNSYLKAFDVPVISDLCEIVAMCTYPDDCRRMGTLRYLIPEFKRYRLDDNPYYLILKQQPQPFFEVNYSFQNPADGAEAMRVLENVCNLLKENADLTRIFNEIYPLYSRVYLSENAWKLECKPEYYLKSVNALLHKTYAKFLQDEVEKDRIIADNISHNRGIKCYTMHASKGLEADIVYILNANEGLIPNERKLDQMVKARCDMDAARSIREERALCYVACTRAKEELWLISTGDFSNMLQGINMYDTYDNIYETLRPQGDDIAAYNNFCERYIPEL